MLRIRIAGIRSLIPRTNSERILQPWIMATILFALFDAILLLANLTGHVFSEFDSHGQGWLFCHHCGSEAMFSIKTLSRHHKS